MKVTSIAGALAALPLFGTYATSHEAGLRSQQRGTYATTSTKPNILFIFTDDQGDLFEPVLRPDNMLTSFRLASEFHGLYAHRER